MELHHPSAKTKRISYFLTTPYDVWSKIDTFSVNATTRSAAIQSGDVELSTYNPEQTSRLKVSVKNTGNVTLTGLWLNADVSNPSGTNVRSGK